MPKPRRCGGTPAMSRPSSVTAPSSGPTKPAIIISVLVLPEPEGPSETRIHSARSAGSAPDVLVMAGMAMPHVPSLDDPLGPILVHLGAVVGPPLDVPVIALR